MDAPTPKSRLVLRLVLWFAVTAVVVTLLAAVVARAKVAPEIIADNAYVFLAADRLYAGFGLTAPPPQVPASPWDWRGDWAFLSRWPMGYPLLLCVTRAVLKLDTVAAASALGVLSCGVALVAWFALACRVLPRRRPAVLVALLAAASTLSIGRLFNPASDTILLALTPLVLLLMWPAMGWRDGFVDRGWWRLMAVGLAAGTLAWVRYAAIFVPAGIGAFLLIEWLWRRVRFVQVAAFAVGAATPVVVLAVLNRALGSDLPFEQQYPLGERPSLGPVGGLWLTAWDRFTAQSFYAHRAEARWFFAVVLPVAGLLVPLFCRGSRKAMGEFLSSSAVRLGAVVMVTLVVMLVTLTALFGDIFNFAALHRYYLPVRPFYFMFFLGGVLAFRSRAVRVLACVPLLMAGAWLVNYDWVPAYRRTVERHGGVTAYGRQALYFEPHSRELYAWLKEQRSDNLLVVSNFHDDIALETWIPACPPPANVDRMETWVERVKLTRGVEHVRVLFVLDPDNHCRQYYLPPPAELVERFGLVPVEGVPEAVAPYVYTRRSCRWVAAGKPELARVNQ